MITRNAIYKYNKEDLMPIRILGIDASINVAYGIELEKDQGMPKRYHLGELIGEVERGEIEEVADYYAVPINYENILRNKDA